jgi:hypothetical protein
MHRSGYTVKEEPLLLSSFPGFDKSPCNAVLEEQYEAQE